MKIIIQAIKLIVFTVAFGLIQLQAQEKHFIYIQNENKEPFYVKLNKEVYSSTPGGYLIIPQLKVGKYNLTTGFAKNQYPEQRFVVDLDKDAGFSLKQYGDKGWGLFDFQSFNTIIADNADNKDTATVNNSIVNNNETLIGAPSKKDSSLVPASVTSTTAGNIGIVNQSSSTELKKDSAVSVSENGISTSEVKKDSVTIDAPDMKPTRIAGEVKFGTGNAQSSATSSVVKTFVKLGNRGFELIYVDKSGFKQDTIALFIPRGGKIVKTEPATVVPGISVKSENNNGIKCTIQATDEDFYKTRLNIAAATTENSMMLAAKVAFKNKCFSTKQVKYLDVLFLSEGSRLRFLEFAKPYVYDPGNFSSLQSQFTEPEMIQKFRVLLKKK